MSDSSSQNPKARSQFTSEIITKDNDNKEYLDKLKKYIQNKSGSSSSTDSDESTVAKVPTNSAGKSSVRGMTNLVDALLTKGTLSLDQFNAIKFEAINTNKSIEDLLKEKNIVSPVDIVKTYAEMQGIEYVDLKEQDISPETLNLLPLAVAKSSQAVVFEASEKRAKVGMKDPLDLQKVKYLESVIGKKVTSYYAYEGDITEVINNKYGAQLGNEVTEALEEVGDTTLEIRNNFTENEIGENSGGAPIIKIVNMILDYGIKNKASDIHIEAREKRIVVRFRIRGILYEKLTIPPKLLPSIITRIKILSGLKIDEHRIPQDGRFQVKSSDKVVDLRVSVMPSIYGEKIVMRLLEKSTGIMTLEQIGVRGVALARLKEALKKTQGIILVTGPTGSGKTQTLATCQKILNTPEVNMVTLEDPVEIRIDGINQVQVNPDVGLTFATGLRSFLRQDPDIIMVGEIRDSETASLAVQAALVGRLVLSTIHTNSAAGAFTRLMDMGVESYLLSSTINILVGQRLVRVLCDCKEPYKVSPEVAQTLHSELDKLNGFKLYTEDHKLRLNFDKDTSDITLYKAVGCPKCNGSGYSSRTGIFEVLKMSEKIASMVIRKATISEINQESIDEGMLTMVQDGFIKALEGITTLEEVLRVKNE